MSVHILHIDTALPDGLVGISQDGEFIGLKKNVNQKDHASFLHPAIKDLMHELNLDFSSLDAIAVTIGPGSYTGIRIGLSSAKGFCMATGLPLITIDNLYLIAKSCWLKRTDQQTLFCPMIDARRMEVFTSLFDFELNELKPAHSLILSENSFLDLLEKTPIMFAGNGTIKTTSIIKHTNAFFSSETSIDRAFALTAMEKFVSKKFENLVTASPLYAKEFYNV